MTSAFCGVRVVKERTIIKDRPGDRAPRPFLVFAKNVRATADLRAPEHAGRRQGAPALDSAGRAGQTLD